MSLGYGGICKKELEDDSIVIYSYVSYNHNNIDYFNENDDYDGEITINKSCLVEPEIHEKIKKTASGRKKLVVKRIVRSADISALVKSGDIQIKNSKNTWRMSYELENIDFLAVRLCRLLFQKYQKNGTLPDDCRLYM